MHDDKYVREKQRSYFKGAFKIRIINHIPHQDETRKNHVNCFSVKIAIQFFQFSKKISNLRSLCSESYFVCDLTLIV